MSILIVGSKLSLKYRNLLLIALAELRLGSIQQLVIETDCNRFDLTQQAKAILLVVSDPLKENISNLLEMVADPLIVKRNVIPVYTRKFGDHEQLPLVLQTVVGVTIPENDFTSGSSQPFIKLVDSLQSILRATPA